MTYSELVDSSKVHKVYISFFITRNFSSRNFVAYRRTNFYKFSNKILIFSAIAAWPVKLYMFMNDSLTNYH